MTDSATGALGPIYLDRYLLDKVAVGDQDFTARKIKETPELARGNAREAFAYNGAGYPLDRVKHRLALRFSNLGSQYDLVEELLAGPGPHELVIWRRVRPVYAGDGSRKTFYLPWRVRDHFAALPVPGVLTAAEAAGKLAVEARVGIAGAALTVSIKSAVDYAAGNPTGTNVWFLDEGGEFKVGTAPLSGERLYLRYVPLLLMFEQGGETSKKYPAGGIREPLDLVLVEQ